MMHIYYAPAAQVQVMCAVEAQVSFRWDFNEMIYLLNTMVHIQLHDNSPSFVGIRLFFAWFHSNPVLDNTKTTAPTTKKKNPNSNIPIAHFHHAVQLCLVI